MGLTPGFWRGKRVLVTGHTGFKGAWLSLWLARFGAEVTGYALAPPTSPSLFGEIRLHELVDHHEADLADCARLGAVVEAADPEVVFHLAAQSLVLDSYSDPAGTFATNVMGTVNLLECLRSAGSLRAAVVATSDKCYRNTGSGDAMVESDALGGGDPYSASKACTEIATAAWADAFFAAPGSAGVTTVRAGNVIGGGDYAANRLVPDLVRAFSAGQPATLRHPDAVRPWQHVLEPLAGYLMLAERLCAGDVVRGGLNFGPLRADELPVRAVAGELASCWPEGGRFEVMPADGPAEAQTLRLDWSRARDTLGWAPQLRLTEALALVAEWHQRTGEEDPRLVTEEHMERYLRRLDPGRAA